MHLYITADNVGIESGGGKVTNHELNALKSLGQRVELVTSSDQPLLSSNPFGQDDLIFNRVRKVLETSGKLIRLAHCYAGCLTKTIKFLQDNGVLVSYTAAAHDVGLSRSEHDRLHVPFNYPHLNESGLWDRYIEGYRKANLLICPSTHSKSVMKRYLCKNKIEIVPHGVDLPGSVQLPNTKFFTVGYLGAYGPDKGVPYLLDAWKTLNYSDAQLILAGRDSYSIWARRLVEQYGGGSIYLMGWVNYLEEFYNRIDLYVQPSVTEGFGIEVLEALAYGRPVVCSSGVGASDCVNSSDVYDYNSVGRLASLINKYKDYYNECSVISGVMYKPEGSSGKFTVVDNHVVRNTFAQKYSWDKIEAKYVETWRKLLN